MALRSLTLPEGPAAPDRLQTGLLPMISRVPVEEGQGSGGQEDGGHRRRGAGRREEETELKKQHKTHAQIAFKQYK